MEVTVEGVVPAIDARAATREVSLSGAALRSIPTARSYNAILPLVPGVVTNVNDVITAAATASFPIHGGRANEGRLLVDGLIVGSPPSGNSATSYVVDVGRSIEVTFRTSGTTGDSETSGLIMNIVPPSGGNRMSGSFLASGSSEGLQWDNVTAALRQEGVTTARPFTKLYDVSGTLGGPLVRDRLWYFVNGHLGASTLESPNVFYNLNAGKGAEWLYVPDHTRPSVLRPHVRERERPRDLAADATQQAHRILGRAGALPHLHGSDTGTLRTAARVARGCRCCWPPP